MEMPSNEAIKILRFLKEVREIAEDCLPAGYDWALLPYLVDQKVVKKYCILPPGREPAYPHGLWFYALDSLGKEVMNTANDNAQKEATHDAKERRRYIFERIEFWIGLLVGWLLGGLTPKEVFEWAGSLFH